MAITSLSLEELLDSFPTSSLDKAMLNNLRGIDFLRTRNALVSNRDRPGFTFFTRPQLNMQPDNLRNVRELSMLLSNVPASIQTYVRCMLDPRLVNGLDYKTARIPGQRCPLIDNRNAFIVPFTNNLLNSSGWPDMAVPTFDSDPGLYNEVWSMVDGRVINSGTYDVTVNYRNTRGDVIAMLHYVLALYSSMVFEGKLVPYLDYITENAIDYNIRIYRIMTDHTHTKVTKMCNSIASTVTGVPTGTFFDEPGDRAFSDANQQMSIRYKCNGFRVFDPISIWDFNQVVCIFNPDMEDGIRQETMFKIPNRMKEFFGFKKVYPRIEVQTNELEWWVDRSEFQKVSGAYLARIAAGAAQNESFEEYEEYEEEENG